MSAAQDRTALSYWFPLIEAAGLPVPKTTIVPMPVEAQNDVWASYDNEPSSGAIAAFVDVLTAAITNMGSPCFLRTDHTSGKHDWKRTCFVEAGADIAEHVSAIVDYSEKTSLIGLPWDTWVVRELLPTIPFGACPAYGDMPICREFRFFVDGSKIECWHPYWPEHALQHGGAPADLDYTRLVTPPNLHELHRLASAAGQAVGGRWSVDILETRKGWFVTDMAEAEKSFHWEGCQVAAGTMVPA